jgi:3-oxoacyl-[acyl-carrier protein] reductase
LPGVIPAGPAAGSSTSALDSRSGPCRESAYAATKGAIEAFTRTLAAEVGHKGITVNAVNPGPTDTGWISGELEQDLLPRFPLGRIGQPEDAARLVAFLASDEAAWITGQIINSEGGFVRS